MELNCSTMSKIFARDKIEAPLHDLIIFIIRTFLVLWKGNALGMKNFMMLACQIVVSLFLYNSFNTFSEVCMHIVRVYI